MFGIAIAAYAVVFSSFLLFEVPGLGLGHFFYIPVALLALAGGTTAGLAGGSLAAGLYALAIVVARLAWVVSRTARRRLEFNLGMALPHADRRTIRRTARQNFRNHSKAYADLMRLPQATVGQLKPLLKVRNQQFLDQALAAGKGVLVVSAHMGSWEAAAAFRQRREDSLAIMKKLAPADWERGGTHPVRGKFTLDAFLTLMAWHDDNHLDQLKRALEGKA